MPKLVVFVPFFARSVPNYFVHRVRGAIPYPCPQAPKRMNGRGACLCVFFVLKGRLLCPFFRSIVVQKLKKIQHFFACQLFTTKFLVGVIFSNNLGAPKVHPQFAPGGMSSWIRP